MDSISTLHIKPNDNVRIFYTNHSTFHQGDAGLDLFIPTNVTIEAGEIKRINLEISCEMLEHVPLFNSTNSKNVSYFLYPRSSISNTPLMMSNSVGIIDSNYRGEIKVAFVNIGQEPFTLKRGERLVQICSRNLSPFNIKLVDDLSMTTRGSGGFGSTGK